MKKFVIIIVILLLNVLTISAQYSLMTRGELCPFDTAVAIHIDTYRLETQKMKLADTLITNLSYQVNLLEGQNVVCNNQLSLNKNLIFLKDQEIVSKQQTINSLLNQLEYKPEKTWWDRNHKPVLFIGGVGVGIGGTVLLINALK